MFVEIITLTLLLFRTSKEFLTYLFLAEKHKFLRMRAKR